MSYNIDYGRYESIARQSQDEKIAQLLVEVEKRKMEEERKAMDSDFELAKKLQEEENARAPAVNNNNSNNNVILPRIDVAINDESMRAKALGRQHQALREHQQKEQEERDRKLALQLLKDEEKKIKEEKQKEEARKAKEELLRKKRQQELDDESLARQLQAQLDINNQPVVPYAPPSPSSYYIPPPPIFAPPPVVYHSHNVVNPHTQYIHQQYCGCNKRNSWDSNHIAKIHTQHCGCAAPYVGRGHFNEGVVHQHNYKCCGKNHVHSVKCHCDYRNHVHTRNCCTKYHVHSEYCHCTNK